MNSNMPHNTTGKTPSLYARIKANHTVQTILRVLQFLSSTISLGLFSARIARIIKTVQRATTSNGAVEGILAAAVAYTLLNMILKFVLKKGGPRWLRLVQIVLDLAFVGGFIAVAVLTSPGRNGSSGPCHYIGAQNVRIEPAGLNCNLPLGTFALAIISTFLHAITAAFNEAKHTYKQHKSQGVEEHGEKSQMTY